MLTPSAAELDLTTAEVGSAGAVHTVRQCSCGGGSTGSDFVGDHVHVVSSAGGLLKLVSESCSILVGLLRHADVDVDRSAAHKRQSERVTGSRVDAGTVAEDRLGIEVEEVKSVTRTSRKRPPAPARSAAAN